MFDELTSVALRFVRSSGDHQSPNCTTLGQYLESDHLF